MVFRPGSIIKILCISAAAQRAAANDASFGRYLTSEGREEFLANWIAAAATFGGAVDTDGDGMPDSYENQYAPTLNPAVDDAGLDPDGDGPTNLQEYQPGTNPTQAGSVLRITSISDLGGNNARLTFLAISNRTYGVEYKNLLNDPSWTTLTNIAAAPINRNPQISTPVPAPSRFYRLRTP